MAPVDSDLANSNTKAVFIFGSHAVLVATLLINITRFVVRAHRDTPISLHTRAKHNSHKWSIALFGLLTAASLSLTIYHALAWRYASYMNWADQSGAHVPGTLWDGWYYNAFSTPREGILGKLEGWQLGRWMQDTNLIAETNSASFGDATGFWWTYQSFVGLITWSVFVGLEGRHRNIHSNIILSFIALAQFASLSTAQNLFFILLIVTPMPLLNGAPAATSGPVLASPPAILSVPALIGFIGLGSLTRLQDSSLLVSITSLGYFILPILLSMLAQPNSLHRATKFSSAAAARKSYEDIFRILAFAALGLHGYFSFRAVTITAPKHQYFKHNFVWNTHQPAGNSRTEQAWAVFIKIVGGLGDNPVVSQVAWDVVFSAVSLCVWTLSHGVDVGAMLRCSCLAWTLPRSPLPLAGEKLKAAKVKTAEALDDLKDEIVVSSPNKRGRGRPKKSGASIANDHLRRSTRASASRAGSIISDDVEDDSEYKPTKATREEVDKFDTDEPGEPGAVKETEAVALAWGLYVLGGLGAISASVLGAETSGR